MKSLLDPKLYLLAIKLLASREHSTNELRLKLITRGYDDDQIELAISRLKQENLLSDERFTQMYVRMRKRRGYGPLRIKAELSERGVDSSMIKEELDANNCEWSSLALQVIKKKFGDKPILDFSDIIKQKKFLQYRGFAIDTINEVIRETEI